jgi:hypothetical protein
LQSLSVTQRPEESRHVLGPGLGGGGGGGITIRITWPTVLALLVVGAIAVAVWWVTAGRG